MCAECRCNPWTVVDSSNDIVTHLCWNCQQAEDTSDEHNQHDSGRNCSNIIGSKANRMDDENEVDNQSEIFDSNLLGVEADPCQIDDPMPTHEERAVLEHLEVLQKGNHQNQG